MGLWHNPRLLALAANMLLGLGLAIGLIGSLSWLASRPYFELRQVQLGAAPGSALRHVNKPTLVDAVRRAPAGNFFTVDMTELKEAVEEVPWVRKATVRRLWPDTLVVSIEEHRAAALWEDSRLVSVYGELFSANLDEAIEDGPLPQLGGPDGTESEVMARYVEMKSIVEPLGISPIAVNLSARRAWTARLNDGTELIIGKDKGVPIAERLERWAESYPLVTERMQRQAAVIDLRYPNGYAVRSLEMLADARSVDQLIADSLAVDDSAADSVSSVRTVKAGLSGDADSKTTSGKAPVVSKKTVPPKAPIIRAEQNAVAKRASVVKKKALAKPARRKSESRKVATKSRHVEAKSALSKEKPSTRELAEIRREATRRAAARYAERSRAAAEARLKALADKRSSYRPLLGVQPSTMRTAANADHPQVITPIQSGGVYA